MSESTKPHDHDEGLADLVGRRVTLERFRELYRGRCPLHPDSSRSLFVDDQRGFFHCFACGKHGGRDEWLAISEDVAEN